MKYGFRYLGWYEYNGQNLDMVKNLSDKLWEQQEWLKDLIIYEINPYAYTSAKGAGDDGGGSGTFNLLTQKLDYIASLGVTGIWLAGFCEADKHFRSVPTVYGCVRPDKIDPRLGTEAEFKDFITEAHKRGIRIFLDVITHGVTERSPLLKSHPEWFKGMSWKMYCMSSLLTYGQITHGNRNATMNYI